MVMCTVIRGECRWFGDDWERKLTKWCPSLLHYLALADGTKWRKCPVCYECVHSGLRCAAILTRFDPRSSIYAKDLKSVKWHDPLAATAFSSLSLLPTDLYSHPTSFYTDAHLPTEPLKMRLIRRPQLSTLALPRSSTWPSEAVPPLRAPWQFTPDAMAFAKFMLGAPDYMKAELEGDLKELEAEVATLQRWGMKGGTDEEIGVVFVKAAMEKVKEQLEKVVEMKTHSVMTARKQALRELQAVEDAVGKHLLAPELPLFSETSSSEVEEDVPTEFLASRSAGGGSIGALSSSAAPFTPGGTTGLPTPPTTINKARPQRKNVNPPTSDADVTYLFYQAASGQNIFLQPLDIRILKSHFGAFHPSSSLDPVLTSDHAHRIVRSTARYDRGAGRRFGRRVDERGTSPPLSLDLPPPHLCRRRLHRSRSQSSRREGRPRAVQCRAQAEAHEAS